MRGGGPANFSQMRRSLLRLQNCLGHSTLEMTRRHADLMRGRNLSARGVALVSGCVKGRQDRLDKDWSFSATRTIRASLLWRGGVVSSFLA
jgi:hypothetical protein